MQMREQHSNAMVVGRLKPGVSLTSATGEMNAIAARLASDYPKSNGGSGVALIPLRRYLMGDAEQGQLLLMGAVGLVLLIVCANVATLSLARSSSRDREMAIRTALGANRPRLVRQLVVESLLLAFIGGGLGLLLATGLGSTLGSLVPFSMQQLNPAGATAVDFRVQAFAFLITLVTGLGFGLAPAWQLSRTNPNDALKDRSSITPSAPGRFRTADAVVVAQVGLATLLVITAGLVLRSLWSLSSTPLGYQPENVLSLHLASPGARVGGSMLRVAAFYIEAADRLARLPGVEAAAVTSNLPFGNDDSSSQFRLLDRPAPQPEEYPSSPYRIVSRDYFRAMGIPLQRGRFFSGEEPMPSIPADNPKLPEIIAALRKVPFDGIVTRSFAQRFWPGQEPIGKQFLVGPAGVEMGNVTIVGVVGDTSQDSLSQSRHEEYYLSLRQFPAPFEYSLILRAHGDSSALAAAAKSELRQLTSQEPVYDVLPLSSRIATPSPRRPLKRGCSPGLPALLCCSRQWDSMACWRSTWGVVRGSSASASPLVPPRNRFSRRYSSGVSRSSFPDSPSACLQPGCWADTSRINSTASLPATRAPTQRACSRCFSPLCSPAGFPLAVPPQSTPWTHCEMNRP
jgi:putative ABC transport system permease protein